MIELAAFHPDRFKMLFVNAIDKFCHLFRKRIDFLHENRGDDFPDKTFLVLRRSGNFGLTSYVFTSLAGIRYALEHDMIPVVDMQSGPNIYLKLDEVGRCNAWEFYFEQPCGYSLRDIAHARNVVIWKDFVWPDRPSAEMGFLLGRDERLSSWRTLAQKCLKVRPEVSAVIDAWAAAKSIDFEKTLGVFVRGTDYVRLRPYLHTVQPEVEVVIRDVRRRLQETECNRIFLVTEDEKIYARFREEFGDIVITATEEFVKYQGGYIGDNCVKASNESELRRRGVDYLKAVVLLAKCSHSLESRAGGSEMAAIIAEKERDAEYYNLGFYGHFGIINER